MKSNKVIHMGLIGLGQISDVQMKALKKLTTLSYQLYVILMQRNLIKHLAVSPIIQYRINSLITHQWMLF